MASFDSFSTAPTRRDLLAIGLGLAGALAAPGVLRAQGEARTLRFGYIFATDSQLGAAATAFANELARRSSGRLAVEQFPNAVLGGDLELLKAVQLGALDFAIITGSPLANVVPEAGVFNIPFLFRDRAHAHAVLDGPLGEACLQKFRAKDVVALAWGENGLRHITNSKREVKAPEDLKGLRMRIPQSEVIVAGFKAWGAEAAPLPFPQLYGALKTGQFDGQENPIATIVASKFDQVQKYLTVSAHVYDPAVIVSSVDAFEDLKDDREAVIEAARLGARASRDYAAEAQVKGIERLRQAGMQVTAEIDRARFVAAMAEASAQFEKKFGADVIAKIRG